jgi:SSS family solute:Na+ symporter
MRPLDWIVLSSFLLFVAVYGVWKTRGKKDTQRYFLANRSTPWYMVTISIMATQASGITFLSTPGQAYVDGMRFVQFYFGLPIAMVLLSITVVPIFHKLKVYTAYELLEQRFDLKNRVLGSILFLLHRGLAAGITILAPALVISVILGWDFRLTIFIIGGLVILYTASGGTEAVYKTHLLQMAIVTAGMAAALYMVFHRLPPDISFSNALHVAGKLGKLNVVNFVFDWKDRYNFWSGLIGGGFLMLSYFGADQSQVQRYLGGRSVGQSRMGLLANGVVKVPMQFIILFIGAMVFVFYQFVTPPLFFNPVETANIKNSPYGDTYTKLETEYQRLNGEKQEQLRKMLAAIETRKKDDLTSTLEKLRQTRESELGIRQEAIELIKKGNPWAETEDTN